MIVQPLPLLVPPPLETRYQSTFAARALVKSADKPKQMPRPDSFRLKLNLRQGGLAEASGSQFDPGPWSLEAGLFGSGLSL
jgi:hypothetical protein